jgi:hypothetical protein
VAELMTTNQWCQALGIATPKLEAVVGHQDASAFALLLVALLERGEAMTLVEVAARFEQAGIAERSRALLALQRCRPGRPPVYRERDLYHLDPHDDELDRWAFRLALRPPKGARIPPQTAVPLPPPSLDAALTLAELDEAWRGVNLSSWSAQRLAVAVLDAMGRPLPPAEVVAVVAERAQWHLLSLNTNFKRRGSAIEVLVDGRWAIAAGSQAIVTQARAAVRERVAAARAHAAMRPDPVLHAQMTAQCEQRRTAHGAELARMARALLVAFPAKHPRAAALLDVGEHALTTFVDDELVSLRSRLATYQVLGAVDVRNLLRSLDFDPGDRRLAELGPPQKTKQLNRSGRTLKITTALLVQGSCGIGKPFGDDTKLAGYLSAGELTKLRRRLEADVKSLHALYEYGRLHGAVRLRWGFLDERIAAPWVHRDEIMLHDLKKSALAMNVPLEVVVGTAPGWAEPWSRARLAYVEKDSNGWRTWIVDEHGHMIDEADVQRARLSAAFP